MQSKKTLQDLNADPAKEEFGNRRINIFKFIQSDGLIIDES